MGLVDTYWLSNGNLPGYNGAQCVELEYGKVRSAGFVRYWVLQNQLFPDPTNLNTWNEHLANGNIVLMPFVSGSFDPGEPKEYKGYGRRPATRGARDQVLEFSDPSYVSNYAFYNSLHRRTDYVPFFRTSNSLHIARSPADLFAQNTIEEDMEAEVVWNVKARVRNMDLPLRIDAEPLQELFQQVTQQATIISFASGLSQLVTGLQRIAQFRVGDFGAPMAPGDIVFTDVRLIGQRVLVLATGMGLPVDYLDGSVDWSTSIERHVEKSLLSSSITFLGGVPNSDLIEIYAYPPL